MKIFWSDVPVLAQLGEDRPAGVMNWTSCEKTDLLEWCTGPAVSRQTCWSDELDQLWVDVLYLLAVWLGDVEYGAEHVLPNNRSSCVVVVWIAIYFTSLGNPLMYKRIVVFPQQKESSGKCLPCISIKQRIDNMYTRVAIHASNIGSLAASQFFPFLLLTADRWILSFFSLLLD